MLPQSPRLASNTPARSRTFAGRPTLLLAGLAVLGVAALAGVSRQERVSRQRSHSHAQKPSQSVAATTRDRSRLAAPGEDPQANSQSYPQSARRLPESLDAPSRLRAALPSGQAVPAGASSIAPRSGKPNDRSAARSSLAIASGNRFAYRADAPIAALADTSRPAIAASNNVTLQGMVGRESSRATFASPTSVGQYADYAGYVDGVSRRQQANGGTFRTTTNLSSSTLPQLVRTRLQPTNNATYNWIGATNDWGFAVNWGGIVPGSGDFANFAAVGNTGPTLVSASQSVSGITFASNAQAYTIGGNSGYSLTIGGGGITQSSTNLQTVNVSSVVLGADQTWNVGAGGLTVSAPITGNISFTKTGSGTLTLTGMGNSISGMTYFSNGTTLIQGANSSSYASLSTASTIEIGSSADTNFGDNGTVTVSGTNGSGVSSTWNLNGTIVYVGNWGTSGTLNINGGALVSSGMGEIGDAPSSMGMVSISGTSSSGVASLWNLSGSTLDVGGVGGTGTLNITGGGMVSSTGGNIVNNYGTGTVTVNGTNGSGVASTWNLNGGDLHIAGTAGTGTLNVTNGGKVVDGSGTTYLGVAPISYPTLNINGGSLTTNRLILGIGNPPTTIRLTNPTSGNGGGYALNLGGNGGSSTIAFVITDAASGDGASGSIPGGPGGPGGIDKLGTGTLTLTGANTFTGGMLVSGGTLVLNAPSGTSGDFGGALQSSIIVTGTGSILETDASDQTANTSTLNISNGGAMNIVNGHTSFAGVTLGGNATVYGATTDAQGLLLYGSAPLTATGTGNLISAPLGLNGTNTITVTGASDALTVSGVIGGSGSGLTKAGAGTLTLTNFNTYTGLTTVNAGTLSLNANFSNVVSPYGATLSTSSMGLLVNGGGTVNVAQNFQVPQNLPVTLADSSNGNAATLNFNGAITQLNTLNLGNGAKITGTAGTNGSYSAGLVLVNNTTNVGSIANGTTTVTGGVANATISVPVGIQNSANLNAGTGSTLTISGGIGDWFSSGALTKSGAGTLLLTSASAYSGGTTISAGTLQLGDGSTTNGSVVGNITDNGALVFANPLAQTYGGIVTGSGSLTKNGTGTLTLTGAGSSIGGAANFNNGTTLIQGANSSSYASLSTGAISYIGRFNGSNGIVTVNGTNGSGVASSWSLNGNGLNVGETGGTGTLNVSGGGLVSCGNGFVGFEGTGTVNVSGTDSNGVASRWNCSYPLNIGASGTGILNITGGGFVSSGGSLLGNSGGTGTVTVDGTSNSGAASLWNLSDTFYLGYGSTGILNITGGGMVSSSGSVYVGYDGAGTATVSGTHGSGVASTWNLNGSDFSVGDGATGILNITNGGKVLNGSGTTFLSQDRSSSTLNINGGSLTTNVLSIDNGAATISLTNPTSGNGGGYALNLGGAGGSSTIGVAIGDAAGGAGGIDKLGTGTLTLTGANTFSGGMQIDGGNIALGNRVALQNSTAILNVANGLSFTTLTSATLGGLAGSGSFALTNSASTPAAVALTIGGDNASTTYSGILSGLGSLTKTGTGTLTLTGVGSSISNTNGNNYFNNGTTLIQGANSSSYASLITGSSVIGQNKGDNGTVTVNGTNGSGAASTWNLNGNGLNVGLNGTGTLNITGGGAVNSGSGSVGDGATGTATVDGSGGTSTWNLNGGTLYVGSDSTGTLNITGGGIVNSGNGDLGDGFGGIGTVNVSGTSTSGGGASAWSLNGSSLYVGDGSTGTLNITDGGKVLIGSGTTHLNGGPSFHSTLNINGGSLTTNVLSIDTGGTPTISLTNPTAGNGGGYALNLGGSNGSSTIRVAIGDAAGGAGGINKTGTGKLTLTGANTFTGGMLVGGGTLALNAPSGTSSNNFGGALQSKITVTGSGSTLETDATDQTANTSTLNINNGGSMNIVSGHTSFAAVTLGGNATVYGATTDAQGLLLNGGAPLTVTGSGNAISAPLGLSGTNVVTVTGASDALTVSGVIIGTGSNIVKAGAGTLTLTGANTYSGGTSINVGAVVASGTALGTGAVSIASGGTLAVGQAANTALGTVLPGYKTLALSSLSLASSTTPILTFNLGTASSMDGSTNDLLQFSGSANALTFSSSSGQSLVGFASEDGTSLVGSHSYELMSFATPISLASATISSSSLNSRLAATPTGNLSGVSNISNGNFSWLVSNGNIVGLNYSFSGSDAMPEPPSVLLALAAFAPTLAIGTLRRRRKN